MTQFSLPQQNEEPPNPTFVDSGPYPRDDWAQKLIIEWVGDAVTTRGPFAKYLNRLNVTNPAGATINVDTGAGYCGGSILDNNAVVAFTANTPGIPSRTDKVVLVENNTNAVYDGTASGVILDFPTVLTDYKGAASIPEHACRLAILRGDAATGNPTALIQNSSYWMIELFRFTISSGAVVSNLIDNRDYVDAENKVLFVMPAGGEESLTDLLPTILGLTAVIKLEDAKDTTVVGRFIVPSDYIADMTAEGILMRRTSAGNVYCDLRWGAAKCGQLYNVRNGAAGFAAESIASTANYYSCHRQTSLATVLKNDIVELTFERDAINAADTVSEDLPFVGFQIEYLGYR